LLSNKARLEYVLRWRGCLWDRRIP